MHPGNADHGETRKSNSDGEANKAGPDLPQMKVSWFRSALIEGTAAGKMPRPWLPKWGWWMLPALLLSLLLASLFGIRHIQAQVLDSAPQILRNANIDTDALEFSASYRNVRVEGPLPEGVSAAEVVRLLEDQTGSNGEDIRYASVVVPEAVSESDTAGITTSRSENTQTIAGVNVPSGTQAAIDTDATTQMAGQSTIVAIGPDKSSGIAEASDGAVYVYSEGRHIVLKGELQSQQQADTLKAAAVSSVGAGNMISRLSVVSGADTNDDQIRQLATVISGIDSDTTATNLSLVGNSLGGTIKTASEDAVKRMRSLVTEESVTIISPVSTRLASGQDRSSQNLSDETRLLQEEINALQQEIRDNVVFDTASARLKDKAYPTLEKVVDAMSKYTRPGVEINGHADWRASAPYNLDLSVRRADAVMAFLQQRGIPQHRVRSIGSGEIRPVASNKSAAGRRLNRRVEFTAREPY